MKRLLRNICIVFCVGLILIPLYLNSRTPDTNRLSDDESGTLTVTVADLGKADAILLQSGEHAMLIDAGYETAFRADITSLSGPSLSQVITAYCGLAARKNTPLFASTRPWWGTFKKVQFTLVWAISSSSRVCSASPGNRKLSMPC